MLQEVVLHQWKASLGIESAKNHIGTALLNEIVQAGKDTKGCFDQQTHAELLILANPLVKVKKKIKEDISGALQGKGAKDWMQGKEPQQWFQEHREKYLDVKGMDPGAAQEWVQVGFQYGDLVLKKVTELLQQLTRFLKLATVEAAEGEQKDEQK